MALKDQLPNRALSGAELAAISGKELRSMLEKDHALAPNIAYKLAAFTIEAHYSLGPPHAPHILNSRTTVQSVQDLTGPKLLGIVMEEFKDMMSRDYIFQGSTAYKRSEIRFVVMFHMGDPYEPKVGDDVRCYITGKAPLLSPLPGNTVVVGLERTILLENPNIDRINHDMPIIVQRSVPPPAIIPENQLPGEAPATMTGSPGVETLEYRYDATQFPAPKPPIDTDISQKVAAQFGVPQVTGS